MEVNVYFNTFIYAKGLLVWPGLAFGKTQSPAVEFPSERESFGGLGSVAQLVPR